MDINSRIKEMVIAFSCNDNIKFHPGAAINEVKALILNALDEVIGRDEASLPIDDIYRTPTELAIYHVKRQARDELRAELRARVEELWEVKASRFLTYL